MTIARLRDPADGRGSQDNPSRALCRRSLRVRPLAICYGVAHLDITSESIDEHRLARNPSSRSIRLRLRVASVSSSTSVYTASSSLTVAFGSNNPGISAWGRARAKIARRAGSWVVAAMRTFRSSSSNPHSTVLPRDPRPVKSDSVPANPVTSPLSPHASHDHSMPSVPIPTRTRERQRCRPARPMHATPDGPTTAGSTVAASTTSRVKSAR
jgi:hypothetical protein